MQHFRVKILARAAAGFRMADAIPVFHRWIQKSSLPAEMLIDVADYQHVPAGPGVLLVAHDAHYGLDETKNRLGLLYTRRTAMEGSDEARLRDALAAAGRACDLLEREPEFAGKLAFDRSRLEISVNDRVLAPNTDATADALRPALHAVLDERYGAGKYAVARSSADPRELFTLSVQPAA